MICDIYNLSKHRDMGLSMHKYIRIMPVHKCWRPTENSPARGILSTLRKSSSLSRIRLIARRYIQTAVSFLTKRVKKPDKDDWGKLKER